MGSTGKSSARCAICGDAAAPLSENPTFPFCSERCRLIDLGNWLGETYRIASRESPDDHVSEDDGADSN